MAVSTVLTNRLKYGLTRNNATNVQFGTQGVVSSDISKTVCLTDANEAPVDSVIISKTQVQIGKKRAGLACEEANIDAK